jgi:hypothetical protein
LPEDLILPNENKDGGWEELDEELKEANDWLS